MLRNIWKVRELLACLVRRDLLVRYQSSLLGFFWSFARPLALVVIFFVAFGIIIPIGRGNVAVPLALHLLVGILVWSYLSRAVTESHAAILSHANLIKKIRLPMEVFPAVSVLGNLVNFLLGMVVVVPVVLIAMAGTNGVSVLGVVWQVGALLALTALVTLLAFALSLIASAVNVFYRDAESLSEVLLQAWFYATPIIYPFTLLYEIGLFNGGRMARWIEVIYWLNPMAPICAAFRRVLLYRARPETADLLFGGLEIPDARLGFYLGIAAVTTGLLLLAGQVVFRHFARSFADEV